MIQWPKGTIKDVFSAMLIKLSGLFLCGTLDGESHWEGSISLESIQSNEGLESNWFKSFEVHDRLKMHVVFLFFQCLVETVLQADEIDNLLFRFDIGSAHPAHAKRFDIRELGLVVWFLLKTLLKTGSQAVEIVGQQDADNGVGFVDAFVELLLENEATLGILRCYRLGITGGVADGRKGPENLLLKDGSRRGLAIPYIQIHLTRFHQIGAVVVGLVLLEDNLSLFKVAYVFIRHGILIGLWTNNLT